MLIRFLVFYLVFITRIKQNACSTTKSLSEDTNSKGTESTNTEPMTPETDSEEETLQGDENTTPLNTSSDDTTGSTASMSKPSCGIFWHYNEMMRCLYESVTLSPEPEDCANSSCSAKTCNISQIAQQCIDDFSKILDWKKVGIPRQAMNLLAGERAHDGQPIRIRPVGRPKNSYSDEQQKTESREAKMNSDVWRLLQSNDTIVFVSPIQLMNSTKNYPFPLTTVDEESKNKTAELIKLVQEAEIVPHQLDLTKPQLQPKRRSNFNPWVFNYRPQIYLQNEDNLPPLQLKNERRYFISNPDVIERYINSRRSRKRRKKGYSTSLKSDSGVLRKMAIRHRVVQAWSNEETVQKKKSSEEKKAGKVNYDEKSDDYVVSTSKNPWDYEHDEWVTTKYNWDDEPNNNDSSAEKSHRDELAEEISEELKHDKEPQSTKENTHSKISKDYLEKVSDSPIHKKWRERDVNVKVQTILKEKGLKNKPNYSKQDEWGDWAKPQRTNHENRNPNDDGKSKEAEAAKKYATQEADQDDSATRPMHTKKKMQYQKNELERQTTKHKDFDYKDDRYRSGTPNKPSKQERNKAGRQERSERLERPDRLHRPKRPEKPERSERPERSESSERVNGPENIYEYHRLNKPSRVERREEPERPARSEKKKDYEEDYDSKKYTKKDLNNIDSWTKEKEQKNEKHDDYKDYDYNHQKRRDKSWDRDYDRKKYKEMDSNEKYTPEKEKLRSHNREEDSDSDQEKRTINIERVAKGTDVKWSDDEDGREENKKSNENHQDIKSENAKISDKKYERNGKAMSKENFNNKKVPNKPRPHHDDTSKDWGKGKQAEWSQENKENLRDNTGENIKYDKKKQNKKKRKEDYDFWNRHAHNDWDKVGVDGNMPKRDVPKRTKKDIIHPLVVKTTRPQPERWDPHRNNDWDKVGFDGGRNSYKHKVSYEIKPQTRQSNDRSLPVYFGYVHTPLPYKEKKSVYDD